MKITITVLIMFQKSIQENFPWLALIVLKMSVETSLRYQRVALKKRGFNREGRFSAAE